MRFDYQEAIRFEYRTADLLPTLVGAPAFSPLFLVAGLAPLIAPGAGGQLERLEAYFKEDYVGLRWPEGKCILALGGLLSVEVTEGPTLTLHSIGQDRQAIRWPNEDDLQQLASEIVARRTQVRDRGWPCAGNGRERGTPGRVEDWFW